MNGPVRRPTRRLLREEEQRQEREVALAGVREARAQQFEQHQLAERARMGQLALPPSPVSARGCCTQLKPDRLQMQTFGHYSDGALCQFCNRVFGMNHRWSAASVARDPVAIARWSGRTRMAPLGTSCADSASSVGGSRTTWRIGAQLA